MTTGISRELVQSYYEACLTREPARIAAFIDDDIDWSIAGPVDLLSFCGRRLGKNAVIETIVRDVPALIKLTKMQLENLLIDGDRAAALLRLSAIRTSTGRTVSYSCAQFMRFRDRKILEFRSLIDSFDAAEQVLGHAIEVAPAQEFGRNVVAV